MDDDAVDRLYGLPLEDFVRERDALAKALRGDGDREGAKAVKALAKPTRAAWVVNRVVREQRDAVDAVAAAADALADAQAAALSGSGGGALRTGTEAARSAIDHVLAGVPAGESEATRDAVRATLHAAVIDPEARAAVLAGRLTHERPATGFGGLAAVGEAAPAAKPRRKPRTTKPGDDDREREAQEARRREEEAREREARRQAAVRRAESAEAAAQDELEAAQAALTEAEAAVKTRRAEVRGAKARVADARRDLRRAERGG